ncbi:MAG TPA: phosphate/phosphite/phosphonate ABC transporter substrate-binding protein [Leptolyngbyaceae cyanobacterium]
MKRRQLIGYSFLLVTGCTVATSYPQGKPSNSSLGNLPDKIRFTVTEVSSLAQLQRDYEAFRTALEEVLEKKVEFVPVESYIAAAAALQLDQLDFVLTGPSEYVVIRARTNAVPAIGITRPNYYTIICVSANSKINSLADLKGKKIALWKVGSTSGYLGPTKILIDGKLDPKSDLQVLMLGNQGLPALKKGEVDAWGGSAIKYEKFLHDEGLSKRDFPAIAKGPLLPNDLFVVSSKLDSNWVKEINSRMVKHQEKLLQSLLFVEEGKYRGSRLVSANDSDYNMIREVYKTIGQGNFI